MQTPLLFLGSIGGQELIIILFVILLLFGARKIPELARGLGKGIREFKDATSGIKESVDEGINDEPRQRQNTQQQPASGQQANNSTTQQTQAQNSAQPQNQ